MFRKRTVIVLVAVLVLAAAAATGVVLHARKAAPVVIDLTPLAEPAKTQNYSALVKAIASVPAGPEGFSFAVLGDTRSDIGAARRVLGRAAEEKPAFILHTGDLVRRGTVEEYPAHHLVLVKGVAPTPLVPVPGNHEAGPNQDFPPFKALYGDVRFSFDYGGGRFVGVNNSDQGRLDDDDLAFLRQELARPGAAHKFVLMHIPPDYLQKGAGAEDGRGFKGNAAALRALMTEMKVDTVFVGHVHGYATEAIDGVRYVITGGGGAPLTKSLGEEGNVRNFILVRVTAQGLGLAVFRLQGDQWVRTDIP
jgi:3',5'-cyclic AMP phosphodiesterase CpdA